MRSKLVHRENVLSDGRIETEREEIYDDNDNLLAIIAETPVKRINLVYKFKKKK